MEYVFANLVDNGNLYNKVVSKKIEMFQKKDYVFGAILLYLFLLMMVFVVKKEESICYCNWDMPCIRFCCEFLSCGEEKIRKHFNESLLDHNDYGNYDDENEDEKKTDAVNYKIIMGRPTCSLRTIPLYGSNKWSFTYVRVTLQKGHKLEK